MSSPIVVIIPTAGRPELLRRTLESIEASCLPDRYLGTIVVENGTKTGAEAVVADFKEEPVQARYLYSDSPNKSKALNLALKELQGDELVVFTDDDVRVGADWLDAYANASAGTLGGVMFGAPFEVDYQEEPKEWLKRYLPASAVGKKFHEWNLHTGEFDLFLGCNWGSFARDLVRQGGFNEHVGPGTGTVGQERDMQIRLHRAGVQQQLIRDALVWHYVPVDRCSEEWILDRKSRHGYGLGKSVYKDTPSSLITVSRKVLYSLFIAVTFPIMLKRERVFEAKANAYFVKGVMAGILSGENRGDL
jgi:glycosyltransferase involved in cell wall biosynthesis